MALSSIETLSIDPHCVPVTKSDISLVIGYDAAPIPPQVDEAIEEVMHEATDLCSISGGYVVVEPVEFHDAEYRLAVRSMEFETKRVVFQQLRKSERVALFVCTAGNAVIEKSRALMKEGDLLKGYVYDVFGSLMVEGAMDIVQESLRKKQEVNGLTITNRYSPGYCGWDVSEQKKLFSLLPEKFCGIELTESCLMRPIKSVSGIIGIGKSVKFNSYTCSMCEDSDCLYRNLKGRDQRVSERSQDSE